MIEVRLLGSLLLGHLGVVELKLCALNDVSVTAAGLAWAGCNLCQEAALNELDVHVAGEGVGAHQLVVGGVVHNVKHTGPLGDGLGWPGEIARVETESTVLHGASTHASGVNAGSTNLGHGWRASEFELPLLAPWGKFATSLAALMEAIT